jgi:hypothetical protein
MAFLDKHAMNICKVCILHCWVQCSKSINLAKMTETTNQISRYTSTDFFFFCLLLVMSITTKEVLKSTVVKL